eukprot:14960075-Ditylum_brightwellii.AAC.1
MANGGQSKWQSTKVKGQRCTQLMKVTEQEAEQLEKQARDELGMNDKEEKKDEAARNGDVNGSSSTQHT